MKKIVIKTSMLTVAVMLLIAGCKSDKTADDFASPPETMTTGVYWYWMSDNISKEGVVKDLHAMKQAGINAVFIGNIGGQDIPYGKVKLFTDEWWDILHAAVKTAGELDIEVGMFNCPGWSHSGGPWIKAEQSMRHLVASETPVTGGGKVSVKLPVPQQPTHYSDDPSALINNEGKPSPHFSDVLTLALPVPADYRLNLFDEAGAKITATGMKPIEGASFGHPTQAPPESPIAIRYLVAKGQEAAITLKLPQKRDARSLCIYPAGDYYGKGELQAKINGQFVTVANYPLYRVFPAPLVGFTPFAPTVASFETVTSDEYRLLFRDIDRDAAVGKIVLSPTAALDKYPEKTLARMFQGANPAYTEYKWTSAQRVPGTDDATAGIAPDKIVDLTDKVQPDGTLVWDAPQGEWLVLRMGMVPNETLNTPASPEGRGWEMDKFSPEVAQYHFDRFLGEILKRIPAEDRKTFRVTVMDSWEKGGQMFTDNFVDSLKARYGYDPRPFLPVLTGHLVGSPEQSERFLWDVRRLTAEMAGNNLMPNFNAATHPHGIETWIENYGDWGFPGEFLLYGKHTDRVGGEFWVGGDMRYIDVAASAAHIYNKPHVYAESFTSIGGYRDHPGSLKRDCDGAFAAGLTRCVLHVYIEQPYEEVNPGISAWFGVEFNRKNTWFNQIDLFTAYLKRCGLMLEQGMDVADIAYFIGEDVPVNTGPFGLKPEEAKDGVTIPALPAGYHADYVNSDILLNRMSVKDGRLTLPHGASYRLLVLPPVETMRPEVLKSIERLVADGAAVLGEAPLRSPSLQNYPAADKELTKLAAAMWGDKSAKRRTYNKGVIFSGMTIEEALTALDVAPDVKLDNADLVYNHRTAADRDIYFIANRSDKLIDLTPAFRVSGRQPQLWNPVDGSIRPLPAFEQQESATLIPMQLAPYESAFIVFVGKGKPQSADVSANFPQPVTVAEINTPWTVVFESDSVKRGPAEPVIFDRLQSWSQHEDERIRYFSGTAVYKNTFTLTDKSADRLYLDLDKVSVMAKVKINGQYAGGIWTPPYRTDISDYVKTGENTVEIEVVSTWFNRIVGDTSYPPEQRRVRYIDTWAVIFKPTTPLRESGLTGTVKIVSITN
jgi:hypothetical protein